MEISEILQRVDELKALLLYGVTAQGKPLKDALDIKGHHEALDYLVAFVQQKQALTEAHIIS